MNPFWFDARSLKPGTKQLVTQAWRRRRREQRLISAGAHNINEVMFFQEATTYQHEVFLGELVLGQVGLHAGRLAQAGRARGSTTSPWTAAMTLRTTSASALGLS